MQIQHPYRIALSVVADLCINTAVLMVTYPIWRELQYQRYPTEYWLRVYLWTAFIATVVVLLVGVLTVWMSRRGSSLRSITVQIVTTFVLLSALAVYADFSEPEPASKWPDLIQDIAAKFCAELQSIRFTLRTASLIAVASGLLLWFILMKSRRAQPTRLSN